MVASAESSPDAAPETGQGWLRRVPAALGRMLGAALSPDLLLSRAVREGRYGGALLTVVLCALLAAAAIGSRLEAPRMGGFGGHGGGHGPPAAASQGTQAPAMSDREVKEKAAKARTIVQVKLGLSAGVLLPLEIFGLALLLWGLGRYVGGKPTVRGTMSLASHACLPSAARSLISAFVALRRPGVAPHELGSLVSPGALAPHHPVLGRLLAGVDPFTLWTVLLLCFGLASAASISRKRSFVAVLVGFALYLALTRAVLGGAAPPPGGPR